MKATLNLGHRTVVIPHIKHLAVSKANTIDRWKLTVYVGDDMFDVPGNLTADEVKAERERIEKAIEDWYCPADEAPEAPDYGLDPALFL